MQKFRFSSSSKLTADNNDNPTTSELTEENINSERERLREEDTRLKTMQNDTDFRENMANTATEEIKKHLGEILQPTIDNSNLSVQTNEKIDKITEKYNKLDESAAEHAKKFSRNDISPEKEYADRAVEQFHNRRHRAYVDTLLDDDNLKNQDRDKFNELRDNLIESSREDEDLSRRKVKYAKEFNELGEKWEELYAKEAELKKQTSSSSQEKESTQEETGSKNKGSLVDDYADVSTEMPSYMDPED